MTVDPFLAAGECDPLSGGAMYDDAERDVRSPITDRLAWYVVATKRHSEEIARARLAERGIESYLPLTVEWPPPAVGRPIQPLFPGYLLVNATLPRDFYRVTWTPGVKAFVVFGESPPPLDERCVEFLRARECPDGFIC